MITAAALALGAWMACAQAADINGGGLSVTWNNTVKYSMAARVQGRSAGLVANPNGDDGDRNFDRGGLTSNRVDLLSELDLSTGDVGARVSAAAWYDERYFRSTDNDSPATANALSVPANEFTRATQALHGRKAEFLDAFVFANGHIGDTPVSVRLGRHTLLWGESLLMADNGISYGQAPIDAVKALSVPASTAKELFMPVGQVSAQWRPKADWSVAGYYQYDWRRTRVPAAGSYFSTTDVLDAGGERIFVTPSTAFFRAADIEASDRGQWGLALSHHAQAINTEFGLYVLQFHDKVPKLYLFPGAGVDAAVGKIGEYVLVFPEKTRVFGASFSTTLGDAGVAGEIHVRRNMPLASGALVANAGADNDAHPLYAVGNTLHAQLSVIYAFPATRLWNTASLQAEIGYQRYTSITKNPQAFSPTAERSAYGLRALFTPTYFQVWPNVDLSVPLSLSYNPRGKSPIPGFNGGVDRGGSMSIGLAAEYESVWLANLQATRFYGKEHPLKDRGFISLSVRHTF